MTAEPRQIHAKVSRRELGDNMNERHTFSMVAPIRLTVHLIGFAHSAHAEDAVTAIKSAVHSIKLAPGIGRIRISTGADLMVGPQQNAGPGNEQPKCATKGDKVVCIYMSSNLANDDNNGPNQCKVSVLTLGDSDPVIVKDQVKITDNVGNRPCNHPKVFCNDFGCGIAYGSNDRNRATVRTFAQAINVDTMELSPRIVVSLDPNNNEGAPDVSCAAGTDRCTFGYYADNVGAYAGVLKLGAGELSLVTPAALVVAPSNIGRPSIACTQTRCMVCAATGRQRPAERGVACSYLDSSTGAVLWPATVIAPPSEKPAENLPQTKQRDTSVILSLPGQPALVTVGNAFVLSTVDTSGPITDDNGNRVKGSSNASLWWMSPSDQGPGEIVHRSDVGGSHATICAGGYGSGGGSVVGLFQAPITGFGQASLHTFAMDPNKKSVVDGDSIGIGSGNADSGYLSNVLGQNPRELIG